MSSVLPHRRGGYAELKSEEITIEELVDILSSLEDLAKGRYYSINSEVDDDEFLGGVKGDDGYDLQELWT